MLGIHSAERQYLVDYRSGAIVIHDRFAGANPLTFATHLHCSGSLTQLDERQYRMTGGQAKSIAAGAAGLTDEEKGEVFVTILHSDTPHRVISEEPSWIPSYIYGINFTGDEDIKDSRHPHYRRWRLEACGQVCSGAFTYGVSLEPNLITAPEANVISLPNGATYYLAGNTPVTALGYTCCAEAVIADADARTLLIIGASSVEGPGFLLHAAQPVDIDLNLSGPVSGAIYAKASSPLAQFTGAHLGDWVYNEYHPRTDGVWSAVLEAGVKVTV